MITFSCKNTKSTKLIIIFLCFCYRTENEKLKADYSGLIRNYHNLAKTAKSAEVSKQWTCFKLILLEFLIFILVFTVIYPCFMPKIVDSFVSEMDSA